MIFGSRNTDSSTTFNGNVADQRAIKNIKSDYYKTKVDVCYGIWDGANHYHGHSDHKYLSHSGMYCPSYRTDWGLIANSDIIKQNNDINQLSRTLQDLIELRDTTISRDHYHKCQFAYNDNSYFLFVQTDRTVYYKWEFDSEKHSADSNIANNLINQKFLVLQGAVQEKRDKLSKIKMQESTLAQECSSHENLLKKTKDDLEKVELDIEGAEVNISRYNVKYNEIKKNIGESEKHKTDLIDKMTPKHHSFIISKAIEGGLNKLASEFICMRKFDVNYQNKNGDTLIHLSVKYNYKYDNFLPNILEMKPDMTVTNKDGNTALYLALSIKDEDAVKHISKAVEPLVILKEVLEKDAVDEMRTLFKFYPNWEEYETNEWHTVKELADSYSDTNCSRELIGNFETHLVQDL